MVANDHTRLVNKMIGLCKNTAKWPSILYDLGYDVQLIECPITIRKSAREIVPDVVAVSDKLEHVVVIDCKSGKNVEPDQDGRYESLESLDFVEPRYAKKPESITDTHHMLC